MSDDENWFKRMTGEGFSTTDKTGDDRNMCGYRETVNKGRPGERIEKRDRGGRSVSRPDRPVRR